ncbi:response regulator with CheY-like receiver [Idiomarina sp. A28L]|uniref:response regulator n=1 Tax=Idiomarina sp. A28L TaxID=1036674 RepID=UPI0002138A75|nr:response regulator [Idiomarina sp. A28L]EGN75884.1 response regulator with CheY-like receiver [Idiomarina sp. A28L]
MKTPLTVLYAEDDPDIQMIASMALEDIGGFELHFCNDGREVVAKLENLQPDLILLDVMMPNMDGPTAFKELKKRHCDNLAPVVFITAKASSHEIARLMAMGAIGVITKPFDPMTLADNVMTYWKRSKNE